MDRSIDGDQNGTIKEKCEVRDYERSESEGKDLGLNKS